MSAEPIISITGNQPKLRFRSEWLSEQEIPSPIAVDIENRTCAMYSKKMAEKKKRLQTYRACAETNAMQWCTEAPERLTATRMDYGMEEHGI